MRYGSVVAFREAEVCSVQNGGKSALFLQIFDCAVGTAVIGNDNSAIRKIGFRPDAIKARLRVVEAVPGEDDDRDGSLPDGASQGRSPAIGL